MRTARVVVVLSVICFACAREGSAQPQPCLAGIPDKLVAGTVLKLTTYRRGLTRAGVVVFRLQSQTAQDLDANSLLKRFVPRSIRQLDAGGSTTFFVDRDGWYLFALRDQIGGDWPAVDLVVTGTAVCQETPRQAAFDGRNENPFGVPLDVAAEGFFFDWRHDQPEPASNWGGRGGDLLLYGRRGQLELGGGVGALFNGLQQPELVLRTALHHAWSKGALGGGVIFGDVTHASFRAPAITADVDVRAAPAAHRQVWLLVQLRVPLTDRDPMLPSWGVRVGFRWDLVPEKHVE